MKAPRSPVQFLPWALAVLCMLIWGVTLMLSTTSKHAPLRLMSAPAVEATLFADGFDLACSMPGKRALTKASISYGAYPQQRPNVDITTIDGLYGYNDTTSPQVKGWPGVVGAAPVIKGVRGNDMVCSSFTAPANVAALNGGFANPSYINGPNVTYEIVKPNGTLPMPGCRAVDVPTSDANMVQWKGTPSAPGSWCNLVPGAQYAVRQYVTDPGACSPTCIIGSVSRHN